jgi:hypothetical protein
MRAGRIIPVVVFSLLAFSWFVFRSACASENRRAGWHTDPGAGVHPVQAEVPVGRETSRGRTHHLPLESFRRHFQIWPGSVWQNATKGRRAGRAGGWPTCKALELAERVQPSELRTALRNELLARWAGSEVESAWLMLGT